MRFAMAPVSGCSLRSSVRGAHSTLVSSGSFRFRNRRPRRVHDTMNQWIGVLAEDAIYRPAPWRRVAVTGPLSVIAIVAMLLGSRFIKPSLPHPHESNAIEARLVDVVPPKPAGLQGGAAAAPVKPKPVEKPHPKTVGT